MHEFLRDGKERVTQMFKDMKKESYSNKIFGDNIVDFSDSLNIV